MIAETETELSIIERAIGGDEVAFARIVAAHHDDVARMAYFVCGDLHSAEEAEQSAWAEAYGRLKDLRDPDRLRPWLMSVAANEARQVTSRRRGTVRGYSDAAPTRPVDPDRVSVIDLANALARLDPKDRAIVGLRFVGGLEPGEIGRALKMTASGVRVRLTHLLERLRTISAMTEPGSIEPFDARFADRVRAYTDVATARRIDPLRVSRTAMSSQRANGSSEGPLGAGFLGRRIADGRWAAALLAVVLVGAVAIAALERLSNSGIGPQPAPAISPTHSSGASAGGPISDLIRHSWQRPLPVTPGMDPWGSGFLSLANGLLDYGREPGAAASRSAVAVADLDILEVTATVETQECAVGDIGAYRWSVEGKDTVMILTAISPDACSARETALAGTWVRSDLPAAGDGEPALPPGTYSTSAFDPFDRPGIPGQLFYTLPGGWRILEDQPPDLVLHHPSDTSPSQPSRDLLIGLIAQPGIAAVFEQGAPCGGPAGDAPGVGHGVDAIVAAIITRAGVVSTPPAAVSIGGYDGQMLDLRLAPSWTGGCQAPEGTAVGIPILHHAGSAAGPVAGVGPDHPLRLILLDLTNGRTLAVAIEGTGTRASQFEEDVPAAMRIIETFKFHAPPP